MWQFESETGDSVVTNETHCNTAKTHSVYNYTEVRYTVSHVTVCVVIGAEKQTLLQICFVFILLFNK